jgi:hypothetical protein
MIGGTGLVIGKAGEMAKLGMENVGPTAAGARKEAGKAIAKATSAGTVYEENARAAQEIEKRVPGLKFTRGQLTDDPQAIMLQRALERSDTEAAAFSREQRAFANDALQRYYQTRLTGGQTGIEDFIGAVRGQQAGIETNVEQLQGAVNAKTAELGKAMSVQETGTTLVKEGRAAKQAAKEKASALFQEIPNDVKVQTQPIYDAVQELKGEFNPNLEDPHNYPGRIINGILKEIEEAPAETSKLVDAKGNPISAPKGPEGANPKLQDLSFQDLTKLRSTVLDDVRAVSSSANPNVKLLRRLGKAQQSIEKTIDQLAGEKGIAGQKYRAASKFYREQYAEKYRTGTMSSVLAKGGKGEETRIATANIAQRFFTKDGADQFVRAMGDKPAARQAMRDYAAYDLLNTAVDQATQQLNPGRVYRWHAQNREVLSKLGLDKEFDGVVKVQRAVDQAKGTLDVFNKSVAARVLNAEPEKVISNAFGGAGSKNTAQVAKDLLALAKGNRAAEEGLKKAFADYFYQKSITTGTDLMGNPIVSVAQMTKTLRENAPAIREMYKGEPKKLQALMDVRKAYEVLDRTAKSPLGGGSDTAENLLTVIRKATEPIMGHSRILNTAKLAYRYFKGMKDQDVNKLIVRAAFDPEFAEGLIMAAHGKVLGAGKRPLASAIGKAAGYGAAGGLNFLTQGDQRLSQR